MQHATGCKPANWLGLHNNVEFHHQREDISKSFSLSSNWFDIDDIRNNPLYRGNVNQCVHSTTLKEVDKYIQSISYPQTQKENLILWETLAIPVSNPQLVEVRQAVAGGRGGVEAESPFLWFVSVSKCDGEIHGNALFLSTP